MRLSNLSYKQKISNFKSLVVSEIIFISLVTRVPFLAIKEQKKTENELFVMVQATWG